MTVNLPCLIMLNELVPLQDFSYMEQCAVGFSAVLFAMKVLVNHYETKHPDETVVQFGYNIPKSLAVW